MTARRTRVKICGITRLQDALLAQELGADALGFVFVPASRRYIEPVESARIAAHLSPFTTIVGLFLDATEQQVESAMACLPGMLPQFHGRETADYCEQWQRPYIKALGMAGGQPDAEALSEYSSSLGFLLDSNEPGALGGTGHVFDWRQLDNKLSKPLILAGGLNVNNIDAAIVQVSPYAVDVSSGVEQEKGIKCEQSLRAFMQAVAHADAAKFARLKSTETSVGRGSDAQSPRV